MASSSIAHIDHNVEGEEGAANMSKTLSMMTHNHNVLFEDRGTEVQDNQEGRFTVSSSPLMSRMALNDNKAGMEGLDKEKINQIIQEASKGSKFYENERKKEEVLNMKIQEQQRLAARLSPAELLEGQIEADQLLQELDQSRDLSHTIVHVDMDAFYAAVEMRDDPSLRDKPMAVGGMGMLSTSNYLARRFGVRAAMPGFIGLKLCPDLVMVPPNFGKYTEVSHQVKDILRLYDPNMTSASLDEAYLDLTQHLLARVTSPASSRTFLLRTVSVNETDLLCRCDLNQVLRPALFHLPDWPGTECTDDEMGRYIDTLDTCMLKQLVLEDSCTKPSICSVCGKEFPPFKARLYGIDVDEAVMEMRNRIEQRTCLTASAGIAPNTMLAKVCSDRNKPNGQYRIESSREEVTSFISQLPIRKISGIGKVTEKLLGALGVHTCSDVVSQRAVLYHLFSTTSFRQFMRIAAGVGHTWIGRDSERKSVSTERTFHELSGRTQLVDKCRQLCEHLVADLEELGVMGRTVTLKIKTVNFEVKTRSQSLARPSCHFEAIFATARQLLTTEMDAVQPHPLRLRLMGVRMSRLTNQGCDQTSVASWLRKTVVTKTAVSDGPCQHVVGTSSSLSSDTHNREMTSGQGTSSVVIQACADTDSQDSCENFENSWDCFTGHTSGQLVPVVSNVSSSSKVDGSSGENKRMSQTFHSDTKGKQSKSTLSGTLPDFVRKMRDTVETGTWSKTMCGEIFTHNSAPLKHSTSEGVEATSGGDQGSDFWPDTKRSAGDCRPDFLSGYRQCTSSVCHLRQDVDCQGVDNNDLPTSSKSPPSVVGQPEDRGQHNEVHMIRCPVCGQQRQNWPLEQLNTHIDFCLNRQTIREMVSDESGDSFPSSSGRNPPSSVGPAKPWKRSRKRMCESSTTSKQRKIQQTVTSFFSSASDSAIGDKS